MAEDFQAGNDISHYQKEIQQFFEDNKKAERDYIARNINLVDENEPMKPILILDENDRAAVEKYYNYIYSTRPVMAKHREEEYDYDMDFEIDIENYDPWKEYQLIYRKVLEKGRAYWLAKALPDWKFLQIARPSGDIYETHENNWNRPNVRDSIFNMIQTERYFDERRSKDNLLKGKSQAIRI
jgi:hypothetical protein